MLRRNTQRSHMKALLVMATAPPSPAATFRCLRAQPGGEGNADEAHQWIIRRRHKSQ